MDNQRFRAYLFVFFSVLMAYGYQVAHNNHNDKMINEAMEEHNYRINRYVRMANDFILQKSELKRELSRVQSMYEASRIENEALKQQLTRRDK